MTLREILFRARHAGVPTCWVYGSLVIEKGNYSIVNDNGKFPVIVDTECQYVGFKDKYGHYVFERDFCILKYGSVYVVHEVVFEDGSFGYKDSAGIMIAFLGLNPHSDIQIIGNSFEHPDLPKEVI